jgi:low affinity Fe/Cu permease
MPASGGFQRLAASASRAVGSASAFAIAVILVIAWAVSGPVFHYSAGWQLTINTATTIVTFLMVFLIQHTQNRDAQVMHLKLDELIRAVTDARDELVDMEHLSDEELARLQTQFEGLRAEAERRRLPARG